MTLNIKQKLYLIIITAVFLTGVSITLVYSYITLQESGKDNREKIQIASQGFNGRLENLSQRLVDKYQRFQNNRKLSANIQNITQGGFLEFHMLPEITNLGDQLGVESFAFYYQENQQVNSLLQLYYSQNFNGNIIISEGQHKLYAKGKFGSDSINDPALFPTQLPFRTQDVLEVREGKLTLDIWRNYVNLDKLKGEQIPQHIGVFNLRKSVDFDIQKLANEIGVYFTLYNNSGQVIYSNISAIELVLPFPDEPVFLPVYDKRGDEYDSVLQPIFIGKKQLGYLSVNISSQVISDKIGSTVLLMSIVSASVVVFILLMSGGIITRFTAPILRLAQASLAMTTGDMDKDIEITRKDELGILADNFNKMRHSIKKQFDDLEREISERKIAQERVHILSQAVEQSPISVLITDSEGVIEYVNSAFEITTGFSLEESKGRTPKSLGSGIELGTERDTLINRVKSGKSWEGEFQSKKKSGELYWEHAHISPVFDEIGEIQHFLSVREDISLRKAQEEHIHHQAHYDALTNLPNRFLALDRLSQQIEQAERNGKLVAVLFLDLDGFKKVNDSLGHEVGDKLLINAAERLRNVVRGPDTVARLGGDEFVVILGELSEVSNVSAIAEKILDCLKKPFSIESRELILTGSAGISIYPSDGESVSELLRNADSAMYHSKELGRNTFSFFTSAMNEEVSRQLAIEEQLHGALERGELQVYYQTQVDIKNGKTIGAEALLRWNNCALGNISPVEFIPVAEQTGLIVQLGEYVLNDALKMVSKWQAKVCKDFRIAVNLSPRQFYEAGLVSRIEAALKKFNVSSKSLELEITEGVLLGGHSFIDESIQALSDLGICIAMDDFGTGYSSLSYLRKYPFDILKIDRSFVKDISNDPADRELINATIAMAHGLGLKVVAEGVETTEQYQFLQKLNCDFVQGYLFSKPMSEEKLFELALKNLKAS